MSLQPSSHLATIMESYGITFAAAAGLSDDEKAKPWEYDDFIPVTKSGKQKSPNMIRNELQRYIDQCKADRTNTQTGIIDLMGVSSSSFRKFMNPKSYKNQWSAVQNSTYWAAAKLLEEVKYEKEQAKKSAKSNSAKRKATAGAASLVGDDTTKRARTEGAPLKKTKAAMKLEAANLVLRICAVEGVPYDHPVYDTCPQVVTKIKNFLQRDGMTKKLLLDALGGINSGSMNTFLSGKKQDQCGNVTYKQAFLFFEKLRLLEGQTKSNARLKNEYEHPGGFSLVKQRPCRYVVPAFYGF